MLQKKKMYKPILEVDLSSSPEGAPFSIIGQRGEKEGKIEKIEQRRKRIPFTSHSSCKDKLILYCDYITVKLFKILVNKINIGRDLITM